jgi:hypothetical protein
VIYVGVDLGKHAHSVCFLDEAGREVARPLRVPHAGAGLRQVQARLQALPGPHAATLLAELGDVRRLRRVEKVVA